jgi:uncharacterized membrane protein (DUF4010 family)
MDPFETTDTGPQSLMVRLIITLGIGLLVGLEREYAKRVVDKEEQFAGVRTYPLLALLGFLSALLGDLYGPAFLVAGFAGTVLLVAATYVMMARTSSYGITTELAGIIVFLLGALVFEDHILFATTITVLVVSLLTLKVRLHSFIATLSPADIRAFIQFTIISALVLPFLPRGGFGPGGAWDLHETWTMVILVTGISLAGYLIAKLMGSRKGTLLEGLVGGLVSSTAVTLSLSRRSRTGTAGANRYAAVGIVAATAVLYPRILLETWIVDRTLAPHLLPSIAIITAATLVAAYLLWRRADGRNEDASELHLTNPLNFTVALQFAGIYMAVQWLMMLATTQFPAQGVYVGSLVFGATDMDAITLSIARQRSIPDGERATAVLLATVSNTVLKLLIVILFGDRSLRRTVGIGFLATLTATAIAMVLW